MESQPIQTQVMPGSALSTANRAHAVAVTFPRSTMCVISGELDFELCHREDARIHRLVPGASIFAQDGMLRSDDRAKRWCDIDARFPGQHSHSYNKPRFLLTRATMQRAIFEIVSGFDSRSEWFRNCLSDDN